MDDVCLSRAKISHATVNQTRKNMDSPGIEPGTIHRQLLLIDQTIFHRCETKIIPLDHKPISPESGAVVERGAAFMVYRLNFHSASVPLHAQFVISIPTCFPLCS